MSTEANASFEKGGWRKVRLGFTLLELAEDLICAFNEPEKYSIGQETIHDLPYKAALCAREAFKLATSEGADDYVEIAKEYYGYALEGIEAVKRDFPDNEFPYRFGKIEKPIILLRSAVAVPTQT